eukprot:9477588-Pyramimonas_sp.AAC.1
MARGKEEYTRRIHQSRTWAAELVPGVLGGAVGLLQAPVQRGGGDLPPLVKGMPHLPQPPRGVDGQCPARHLCPRNIDTRFKRITRTRDLLILETILKYKNKMKKYIK